jgi:membrane-bound metal-dependent hydrolase YbcI (DUF457 family)
LLLKAAAPRAVSFSAFVAANVVIDVESLINLISGRYPVHAELHTFVASLLVGALVGGIIGLFGRWRPTQSTEWSLGPALVGGVAGGVSHPFLDGIMHGDIQPFLPATAENPLYRMVELETLHGACAAAGLLGAVLLAWRWSSRTV